MCFKILEVGYFGMHSITASIDITTSDTANTIYYTSRISMYLQQDRGDEGMYDKTKS
jgi:hypothetical protein